MTEQQPYEVVAAYDGWELRRYPAHVVAETEVGGPFEAAGNLAFPRLAGYIGGRNRSQRSVAMTAPVVQEPAAEKIAMTAPVVQVPGAARGRYLVSFVLPSDYSPDTAPEPTDARVRVREVPAQLVAAVRYSGWWTKRGHDRRVARLREAAEQAGLHVEGPPRFARYDPPWTPWFLRRNEVLFTVNEQGPAG